MSGICAITTTSQSKKLLFPHPPTRVLLSSCLHYSKLCHNWSHWSRLEIFFCSRHVLWSYPHFPRFLTELLVVLSFLNRKGDSALNITGSLQQFCMWFTWTYWFLIYQGSGPHLAVLVCIPEHLPSYLWLLILMKVGGITCRLRIRWWCCCLDWLQLCLFFQLAGWCW